MNFYKNNTLKKEYELKIKTECLIQEKEKKTLIDNLQNNKFLATGKDAYERIYNKQGQDIVDLIQGLSSEAFPNTWKHEVKVEEFTNFILLIQVDISKDEPNISEVIKYLSPVMRYGRDYLNNVAVFDKRHRCYLFFDESALNKLNKAQTLNNEIIDDIKNKGKLFTRYNSLSINFQIEMGHILIPAIVSGEYGSYKCLMLLDTGASSTVISLELAQNTGREDLNEVEKKNFSTAKGLLNCPIVKREIVVDDIYKKQGVAVNTQDNTNLLGVDFFEDKSYIIDTTSNCIYVWDK